MLLEIAFFLLILWFFGLITSYTIGGLIHILFVVAIIMVLIRLIKGKSI
ncbi:MAG: lmo0937 family membrane protein [Candidatus Paceibacterota bacterium]